jgi:hypothetical protein
MGKSIVNSLPEPQAWMIERDGFFCYLAGDLTGPAGCDLLSQIPGNRFLMAGPLGWEANEASCRLAEKLGYRTVGEYPAFYVK